METVRSECLAVRHRRDSRTRRPHEVRARKAVADFAHRLRGRCGASRPHAVVRGLLGDGEPRVHRGWLGRRGRSARGAARARRSPCLAARGRCRCRRQAQVPGARDACVVHRGRPDGVVVLRQAQHRPEHRRVGLEDHARRHSVPAGQRARRLHCRQRDGDGAPVAKRLEPALAAVERPGLSRRGDGAVLRPRSRVAERRAARPEPRGGRHAGHWLSAGRREDVRDDDRPERPRRHFDEPEHAAAGRSQRAAQRRRDDRRVSSSARDPQRLTQWNAGADSRHRRRGLPAHRHHRRLRDARPLGSEHVDADRERRRVRAGEPRLWREPESPDRAERTPERIRDPRGRPLGRHVQYARAADAVGGRRPGAAFGVRYRPRSRRGRASGRICKTATKLRSFTSCPSRSRCSNAARSETTRTTRASPTGRRGAACTRRPAFSRRC